MKISKYIIAAAIAVTGLASCGSAENRDNATLGNTSDTNAVAGVKDTTSMDSSKLNPDSTRRGNVSPTGRAEDPKKTN